MMPTGRCALPSGTLGLDRSLCHILILRKVVRKKNGRHPSIPAMSMCVAQYKAFKHKKGRKPGSLKTTKQEDKQIMKAFHKMRPPGHDVFAWQIKTAMPKQLAKKVSNKTICRRVCDKGYHYEKNPEKLILGFRLQQRG